MFAQFMDALQGPAVGAAEQDDKDTDNSPQVLHHGYWTL